MAEHKFPIFKVTETLDKSANLKHNNKNRSKNNNKRRPYRFSNIWITKKQESDWPQNLEQPWKLENKEEIVTQGKILKQNSLPRQATE